MNGCRLLSSAAMTMRRGRRRRGRRLHPGPLLLSLLAAGCASPLVATVAPALSTAPRSYFVRVAEALTSPSMSEPMRVAPRMFSGYQVSEACQQPRRIARLEAPAREVNLRIGERLALSMLRVVAVSDGNVAVPDVPVVIEAEEENPGVIALRSDDPDLDQGRLRGVSSGRVRIRIRTLCAATNAEMTITATVTP